MCCVHDTACTEIYTDRHSLSLHDALPILRDVAERDEDGRWGELRDRGFEERPAGADFLWRRLVLRRQAPNRVDDDRAVQRHPVVGPGLVAPLGQPEFIERRIEQIARIIAGERPPGAIRALLARREPDDREPRVWVTEGGHRRVPPIGELGAQFLTECDEAGAKRAIVRRLGRRQGAWWGHPSRIGTR